MSEKISLDSSVSNYQYAIADFCKKRNLQTAQFDKKSISFKRYIF